MLHPHLTPQSIAETGLQIGLNSAAIETVLSHLPNDEEIRRQYALLHQDPEEFFKENDTASDRCLRYLALFTAFALLAHKAYAQRGISETVWTDTMHDIARWSESFAAREGVYGVSVNIARWLARHIRLELFALGELQFEPLKKADFPLPDSMQHLPVLNVHIPKGADLSQRSESYRQALVFFGVDEAVATCHSWLLSPALKPLLSPASRILAFQSEYTIACLDEKSRQAEERIFGNLQADPALYPATTSLQHHAREALLSGKTLPAACGWLHLL